MERSPYRNAASGPSFNEAFNLGVALQRAIDATKQSWHVMLLGGFLFVLTDAAFSSTNFGEVDPRSEFTTKTTVIVGLTLMFVTVRFFISPFVLGGYLRAQADALNFAPQSYETLFSGGATYTRLLSFKFLVLGIKAVLSLFGGIPFFVIIARIVSGSADGSLWVLGILGAGTATLAALVYFYLWLGLSLAERYIVFSDLEVVEAVKQSWSVVSGNRLQLALFTIVTWVVAISGFLGVIVCCVGVAVTLPLTVSVQESAWTHAFLELTGRAAPPPPSPAPPTEPTPSMPVRGQHTRVGH